MKPCSYFRSTATGEPCFGAEREGVRPCTARPIGQLVIPPLPGEKDRSIHKHPVCAEHWEMRRRNLGESVTWEPA